jgi:hypothetical protein
MAMLSISNFTPIPWFSINEGLAETPGVIIENLE